MAHKVERFAVFLHFFFVPVVSYYIPGILLVCPDFSFFHLDLQECGDQKLETPKLIMLSKLRDATGSIQN